MSNFAQHAEMDKHGVMLRNLSPEQSLALSLTQIVFEADEVFANLNMVMADLARLQTEPRAFADRNPFCRYKLPLERITTNTVGLKTSLGITRIGKFSSVY